MASREQLVTGTHDHVTNSFMASWLKLASGSAASNFEGTTMYLPSHRVCLGETIVMHTWCMVITQELAIHGVQVALRLDMLLRSAYIQRC